MNKLPRFNRPEMVSFTADLTIERQKVEHIQEITPNDQ